LIHVGAHLRQLLLVTHATPSDGLPGWLSRLSRKTIAQHDDE
jgi:hypothetical protein